MAGPVVPVEPSEAGTTDPPSLADAEAPPFPDVPPAPSVEPTRRTPLAIWSLVLALAPWVFGIVAAIVSVPVYPSSGGVAVLLGLAILGCYVGSVLTGVMAIRRVRRSDGRLKGRGLASVGLGVSALWIVAVVAIAVMRPGDELLRDDFEGIQSFWTGEDATVSKAYANGGYEVLIKDPDVVQPPSRSFLDEGGVDALSFSADVTIVRGPEENMGIALGCWESESAGYLLYVFRNGEYLIADYTGPLAEGQAGPLRGSGQANRISITCDAGGAGTTTLRLTANGEEVVRFEDPDGGDAFVAIGFHVATAEADTLVRFDNALAVRE